jgi:hypothetical protein
VIDALRVVMKAGVARSYGGLRALVDEVDRVKVSLDKIRGELGLAKRPKRGRS